MSLQEKLMVDLKQAMRDKNVLTRDTLRMLKTALDREALATGDLDEAAELKVVAREVKSRKESAAQYDEGGRADLADKERAEIVVLEAYLPKAMNEDEARAALSTIASELGATEMRDMGKVIKAAMARHAGALDGKMASTIAREILGK